MKTLMFDEIYWSHSNNGVARGMHCQIPPFHGRKLVFATAGSVRDWVIDLRVGSPTFGQVWSMELSPSTQGVLIPAGCAHGFEVLEGPAILIYAQEGTYHPEADTGINMQSLSSQLQDVQLDFSERDLSLPHFSEFNSPFAYEEADYPQWNVQS